MYYRYHEINKIETLASKMYCTLYFFVITLTPYCHTKPKLNSNLAIAKICMVYGRLHELSLSKMRINYILVASFFKPLLSFVPKAIFIIYTPTLFPFVWEKFFNPSNSTDQIFLFSLFIYFGFI